MCRLAGVDRHGTGAQCRRTKQTLLLSQTPAQVWSGTAWVPSGAGACQALDVAPDGTAYVISDWTTGSCGTLLRSGVVFFLLCWLGMSSCVECQLAAASVPLGAGWPPLCAAAAAALDAPHCAYSKLVLAAWCVVSAVQGNATDCKHKHAGLVG